MIVRIMGEGQFDVGDGTVATLHELDERLVGALEAGDEGGFTGALSEMLDHVRREGRALADDDLSPSELILPPADSTLAEARSSVSAEGLIPD